MGSDHGPSFGRRRLRTRNETPGEDAPQNRPRRHDTLRFSVLELARVTGNLSRALWRSIMSTDEPGTASSDWFGGATHDAQGAASVALDSPPKRRSGGYR